MSNTYLIKLTIPIKEYIHRSNRSIWNSNPKHKTEWATKWTCQRKREHCYFAYGMTDIDFYKLQNKFAITDSTRPGHNVQLLLSNRELKWLVNSLNHESKEREAVIYMLTITAF